MKEALLYKKLAGKKVRCGVCSQQCLIQPGQRGLCGVQENRAGKLISLVYGKAITANVDPIEKKPFFHFMPGSTSLSLATVGCNFSCQNCQNWDISQGPKLSQSEIKGENLPPEKIIQAALDNNCPSISYTYTEPTIFLEYALETMKIAEKKKLRNCWVTNGYMTEETCKMISPYLDAANVDLKSFEDDFYQKTCGGRLQPVLDTLRLMKKFHIWLEVTTLIIPTLNDDEDTFRKIARFIHSELGPETPWHLTQFSPEISWKLQRLSPTPVETIEKACQIGLKTGLKYVYSGNVPGLASEDTYCPHCQEVMIDRTGYQVVRFDDQGKCSLCGQSLDLIL
ncbi:MAG TPA: AmmeMemoRadiSam system radical SAM enzyme [Candidatus Portnoybacteria bacterium]|nr:AmmeMemoRadiSam system radical SAM enzyme [Candidatus Portnoybacteria bacterium]